MRVRCSPESTGHARPLPKTVLTPHGQRAEPGAPPAVTRQWPALLARAILWSMHVDGAPYERPASTSGPTSSPTRIRYVRGDICRPQSGGEALLIPHIVNDANRQMGAGVAKALRTQWPAVEAAYHAWAAGNLRGAPFARGNIQLVRVVATPPWWVVNMVAQGAPRRIGGPGPAPIDLTALRTCLEKLTETALAKGAAVHMPKIGALRAGGDWDQDIVPRIEATLCAAGVAVTVYEWINEPNQRRPVP